MRQMLSDYKEKWNYSCERLISHLRDRLFIVKDGRQSQLLDLFLVAKASHRQDGQSPIREEEKRMRAHTDVVSFATTELQRRRILFNILETVNTVL